MVFWCCVVRNYNEVEHVYANEEDAKRRVEEENEDEQRLGREPMWSYEFIRYSR